MNLQLVQLGLERCDVAAEGVEGLLDRLRLVAVAVPRERLEQGQRREDGLPAGRAPGDVAHSARISQPRYIIASTTSLTNAVASRASGKRYERGSVGAVSSASPSSASTTHSSPSRCPGSRPKKQHPR